MLSQKIFLKELICATSSPPLLPKDLAIKSVNVIFVAVVVVVFILMNVNPVLEHQENFYIIYEVIFSKGEQSIISVYRFLQDRNEGHFRKNGQMFQVIITIHGQRTTFMNNLRTVPRFATAHTFCASQDGPGISDFLRTVPPNRLIARDVMAAMLVVRNNKIFLLWELTSIFMQTM